MSEFNTGGPAFPCPMSEQTYLNQDCAPFQGGMTLRDYFAAKAMQAFINRAPDGAGFGSSFKDRNLNYSNAAYAMADAMLQEREQN